MPTRDLPIKLLAGNSGDGHAARGGHIKHSLQPLVLPPFLHQQPGNITRAPLQHGRYRMQAENHFFHSQSLDLALPAALARPAAIVFSPFLVEPALARTAFTRGLVVKLTPGDLLTLGEFALFA